MSKKESTAQVPIDEEHSRLLQSWIEEHSSYLLGYTRKYFRSRELCEDLVQETFLAAVEAIEGFQGRSAPRTWLVGILRHKILDRIRAKSRDKEKLVEDPDLELLSKLFDEREHWRPETGPLVWNSAPDKVVRNKEFLGTLQECLAKLPERIREIFLLREFEELSREEIAEKLGLKENHIGVLLFRSRADLQNCLQMNWLTAKRGVLR